VATSPRTTGCGDIQGRAETGPRALGHRSIVANPCNPRTLEVLNKHVKYREAVRPLAPMATFEAARRWFDLPDGASDADYNAFNYMVLTARARPEAWTRIPAVIHRDKTARVQIVRQHIDPFMHAYLKALGRRIGVEVAVNTSFNVAGPIVQNEVQALETLKRSNGLDAAILIADDGRAFAAWHNANQPPKDGGTRFRAWLAEWYAEVGVLRFSLVRSVRLQADHARSG
jgi:carbamoyltransferase